MRRTFKNEKLILLAFVFVAFLIFLLRIKENYLIYLSADEFNQWGTAARINGDNWGAVIGITNSYYSYFYGAILAIFYRIFDSSTQMYQAAVVVNSLFASLIVVICHCICREIDSKKRPLIWSFIGLLCALSTANIVNTNLTWSEIALTVIVWLQVLLAVKMLYNENGISTVRLTAFLVLLFFGYATHQRCLGLLVSGLILLAILGCTNRLSVRQKIYLIILTAVLLGAHILIKQQYQEVVYNVSQQGSLGNDYSSVSKKLTAFFSLEGFIGTISAMAGQWFYFGAATFIMGYYGMFSTFKKCRTEFVKGNIERALFFLYIILSFVLTFLICGVALNPPGRVDHVIYGRYIEITFGFFIVMGWMDFLDREQRIRDYAMAIVPFVVCGMICGWRIKKLNFAESSIFQYVCSPAIAVEAAMHNNTLLALYIVIVTLLVFGFVVVTKYILDHKGAYSLYMSLMIIVLITNVLMGLCVNERVVLKTKHVFYDFSETLLNASEENGQDMNKWIVYPGNEGISAGTQIELACIQFRLKSNCLIMMSSDDKPGVENTDDNILMIPSAAKSVGEYDVIAETGNLKLVQPVREAE